MAFALTWKVEFGDCAGLTDISSYVMSLNITSDAMLGKAGRSEANITINNFGGQFTPGGTGTYASTDWFTKALVVTATSGANTGTSFVGIITSVENSDVSAKEAYFTIQALDFISVSGRTTQFIRNTATNFLANSIRAMVRGDDPFSSLPRTTLGSATGTPCTFLWNGSLQPNGGTQVSTKYGGTYGSRFYFGDALNNIALASAPNTMYSMDFTRTVNLWTWIYNGAYPGNRPSGQEANTFDFKGDGTALTSGQLPFNDVHIGFQTETLINVAGVGNVVSQNDASVDKYSSRTVYYFAPGTDTTAEFQTAADIWSNRYSTIRYIPDNLSLDYSNLRSAAVDDGVAMLQFMYLLWPKYSLWNRASVKVKGAGQASATTYEVVTNRTTINATPSNTTISIRLISGIDNQGFNLDSATYGVLDQNRL